VIRQRHAASTPEVAAVLYSRRFLLSSGHQGRCKSGDSRPANAPGRRMRMTADNATRCRQLSLMYAAAALRLRPVAVAPRVCEGHVPRRHEAWPLAMYCSSSFTTNSDHSPFRQCSPEHATIPQCAPRVLDTSLARCSSSPSHRKYLRWRTKARSCPCCGAGVASVISSRRVRLPPAYV
jgi:hypothetical protein